MRSTAAGTSFCGGSLIHPKWILTAAHCVSDIQYVNVGTHFVSGTQDGTPVKVIRKIRYPGFWSAGTGNDFALLELETTVPYPPVKIAAADGSDNPVGIKATALGWGLTTFNGKQSNVLLQVDVNVVFNNDCKKNISTVTDTMLCAGGELNKDACGGDSGGPLVVKNNGMITIIGIVELGYGVWSVGLPWCVRTRLSGAIVH